MRRYGPARSTLAAVATLALALAATGCGGGDGAVKEVSQEGKGGYPWVATDEICNTLPYERLADPLGSRAEVADRAKRTSGGSPGFSCTQPLAESGAAAYGGVKVEVDFAFTESVAFAQQVFATGRNDTRTTVPDGGQVDVKDVGREAIRFGYDKPKDLHQVRELQLRDSNLLLTVTVTADARTEPTPESLKKLDGAVDSFARGVLDAVRK
ncbi:hypothetical protein OHS33_31175 [Streptomyces sp. NBC_00536]|uniref:hypothetical protein n=1 Tax=Streptomyces sp. NBC_00536 TaxID=2975769 RepID=UPI002E814F09|nr:hypothetical protein [Streptomyces sp. NBC_00536]WUC82424.1 hypothetical protein OHS33_31175 [Streptomyces sp. NBC_00536]